MRKILIIVPISFIAILLTCFMLFQTSTSQKGVEIDGNYIDNNFNNTLVGSGKVVRQNDAIYYYYQPDGEHIKNGLYQISKMKTDIVYHPDTFSIKDTPIYYMQSSANEILLGSVNDTPIGFDLDENKKNYLVAFDTSNNAFCNTTYFNDFNDKINYYYLIGEKIYFATDEYIFLYSNEKYTKLLSVNEIYHYDDYNSNNHHPGFNGWYLADNKIYYFSSSDCNFCSYDVINKKTDKIFDKSYILSKTKTKSIDELNSLFFISNNKLILTVSDIAVATDTTTYKYYVVDLHNLDVNFIAENSFSEVSSVNFYNDIIYLGSDTNGLRAVNLTNNEIYSLTDKQVHSISVVDDKYIYYTDEKYSLYRITNDGKSEEKIFS